MKRQMSFALSLVLLFGASVGFFGCKKKDLPDISQAKSLPYLRAANGIGIIPGFNADNSAATQDSMTARFQDALTAGMSVGRLQIDWPELEPTRGDYAKEILEAQLQTMANQGLDIFLTISAYDSDGPVLPEYLEGAALDGKRVISRFNALMDWVIPMLASYQGFVIAVANEPDNEFGENAGLRKAVVEFTRCVQHHIHTIDPQMAVTVTMAEGNLNLGVKGMAEVLEIVDVASWNFYGSNYDFTLGRSVTATPAELRSEMLAMLAASGDKALIFQELGMHADGTVLNSSEEAQRLFFETFFSFMETEPRIRAVTVFQMVDWSPATTALLTEFFDPDEVPASFIAEFEASLGSIGLLNYADGSRKLAWTEFMDWVVRFD